MGTLFLELCTPRVGEVSILGALPKDVRVGVGVVIQKTARIESPKKIVATAERAIGVLGPERVLLNPDCGFATFADNPIASADIAQRKLAAMVQAKKVLQARYRV